MPRYMVNYPTAVSRGLARRTRLRVALYLAYVVVVIELLAIAYLRFRYMGTPLTKTIVQVIVGGGIVFVVGLWLEAVGGGF